MRPTVFAYLLLCCCGLAGLMLSPAQSGPGLLLPDITPLAGPLRNYRITHSGMAELAEQRRQWDTVVDTLKEIWLGPGDARPLIAIPLEGRA